MCDLQLETDLEWMGKGSICFFIQ